MRRSRFAWPWKSVAACLLGFAAIAPNAIAGPSAGLGPIDCMPVDATPGSTPFLPFYQAAVSGSNIDDVVNRSLGSSLNPPSSNRFTLRSDWVYDMPFVPIASWALGTYTGFTAPGASWSSYQRGHVDAYGNSGLQGAGTSAGLWLNSMDASAHFYGGSNSLNIGCWYNEKPYPHLFPSLSHELDVSFHARVAYDGSGGNAHAQSYFQLIAVDTRGACANGCPGFIFTVLFYACVPVPNQPERVCDQTFATTQNVQIDGTGTTPLLIAQAGLNASGWLQKMGDSIPFQYSTSPNDGLVHFRISAVQFTAIRNAVVQKWKELQALHPKQGDPDPEAVLSSDPLDYGISLLNVNGEVYDPCNDNGGSDGVPDKPCLGGEHAQLGMSVRDIRIASTLPHAAAGAPRGIGNGSPSVVFKDASDKIRLFSQGQGAESLTLLTNTQAAGDPTGAFVTGVPLVFYRDNAHHIRTVFQQGGNWTEWDMSSGLAAADAYTDPTTYVDAAGALRLFYRDIVGDVHEFYLDAAGWHHRNVSASLSAAPPPALGPPTGYTAGSAQRIVYRSTANRVIELYYWAGQWHQWDMTALAGAEPAYSDPKAFIDADGMPRVVYRDIVGDIHEFRIASGSWQHTNISDAAAAPLAIGSPMGWLAGGAPRVVYRGTDDRLHELVWWSGAWLHNDLSSTRGVLPVQSDPVAYIGSDNVPRVVYKGPDGQIHELYYAAMWLHRDL